VPQTTEWWQTQLAGGGTVHTGQNRVSQDQLIAHFMPIGASSGVQAASS